MHEKEIIIDGIPLEEAKNVLIMLHGRGSSANDILGIADHLDLDNFAIMAPQATHSTWYPKSFMAPVQENEPWLSSALDLLKEIRWTHLLCEFLNAQVYGSPSFQLRLFLS